VWSGRVSKHHGKASNRRVSSTEVRTPTDEVRQKPQRELTTEIISSSEDDAYEHAGTDQDSSERSGSESPTDKDTPTRNALEKRRDANKEKIKSRRLGSAKKLVPQNLHGGRLSSSVGRSSPTTGRTPVTVRRRSPSPATGSPLPLPSNTRFLSIEALSSQGDEDTRGPDEDALNNRGNHAVGAERQVLAIARNLILDFTLFQSPMPSALDLTEVIHLAWADAEAWQRLSVEPSAESLQNVSKERTRIVL